MDMLALMYVAIGGAIGSMGRYTMTTAIGRLYAGAPAIGTLAVNIIGAFLMGVFIAAMASWLPSRSRDLHLLFAVGALGGFTTFSAFSLDLFVLYTDQRWLSAAVYVVSSVVVSLLALMAGMWLTHKLAGG